MHHHKLFNDNAKLYESSRPEYPAEIFKYLSSLCSSTNLVWDSACGNGQAAIGLIKEFDKVYATDVSVEQVANAKLHHGITYEVAPSENTKLRSDSCDLVCVAQALHWFDYELFWPEVLRVLKPRGVFSAWGYNWPSLDMEIDYLIKETILDIIEPYWASQNKLIWNHYQDLDFPFEKIVAPEFKMVIKWNLDELFNLIHSISATRRCMDDIGNEFFQTAYSAVSALWGNPLDTKVIDLDFVFYVGCKET